MANFCSKCGAQIQEGNAFCQSCGTPVAQPQQNGAPQPQINADNNGQQQNFQQQPYNQGYNSFNNGAGAKAFKLPNKKVLIFGGAGLAAIILIIVIIAVIAGGSYKDPLNDYVKVLEQGSAKAYANCVFDYDDIISGTLIRESDYLDDAIDLRADFIESYGADAKCSYQIVSKEEINSSEIKVYNAALKALGANKYQIKKCYKLKVVFTYKGSVDVDTEQKNIAVVKTGDGWKFMETTPYSIYYY